MRHGVKQAAGRKQGGVVVRASLVACAVAVLLVGCGGSAKLTGTDLGKTPAPDFTLTDQHGETVRLSQFRGKAVILTFIYTSCPDVCPIIAENLRVANDRLSPKARQKVALLAVTVDPTRDTQAALLNFSQEHGLANAPNWYALRGTEAQLAPVWHAYGIDPGAMIPSPLASRPYTLAHSDAIYLIDPQGRERVLMHSDTPSKVLAANLNALVG